MGVRRDATAGLVRFLHCDPQLLVRELWGSGSVAAGEHAAAGRDLDHVDAVLDMGADDMTELIGAVGDVEVALERVEVDAHVGRIVVQIAVTSRDADAGAAGHDAWPREVAFVDQVAKVGGKERLGADVAHGGEACFQRAPGVDHRRHRGRERRGLEGPDVLEVVRARLEVHVAVDQARQHRRVGKIDDARPRRDGDVRRGNAVVLDLQRDVLFVRFGETVEEPSRLHVDHARRGGEQQREQDHALKTSSSSTRPRHSAFELMNRGARTRRCSKPR